MKKVKLIYYLKNKKFLILENEIFCMNIVCQN